MTTSRRFEDKLYEYYQSIEQYFRGQPIVLGGVAGPSGGLGGHPGGFIGYLPQTRVAYDTSEIASSGLPVSGMSLLDNLNHIRWDIQNISASGSAVDIEDDGSPIASNVTVINFTNELVAIDAGGGQVNVTFSGGLDTLDNIDTTGKTDGQVLTWDNDISTWVASGISQTAPSGPVVVENQFIFTVDGDIDGSTVGLLPLKLYSHDITGTVKEVLCAVNTVPVSSGVRVNVTKNGTTILNSPNYVEIPVGSGYADSNNIATSGFVKNDYFQIEIVREDSDASDLSVHVRYYWEA